MHKKLFICLVTLLVVQSCALVDETKNVFFHNNYENQNTFQILLKSIENEMLTFENNQHILKSMKYWVKTHKKLSTYTEKDKKIDSKKNYKNYKNLVLFFKHEIYNHLPEAMTRVKKIY